MACVCVCTRVCFQIACVHEYFYQVPDGLVSAESGPLAGDPLTPPRGAGSRRHYFRCYCNLLSLRRRCSAFARGDAGRRKGHRPRMRCILVPVAARTSDLRSSAAIAHRSQRRAPPDPPDPPMPEPLCLEGEERTVDRRIGNGGGDGAGLGLVDGQ